MDSIKGKPQGCNDYQSCENGEEYGRKPVWVDFDKFPLPSSVFPICGSTDRKRKSLLTLYFGATLKPRLSTSSRVLTSSVFSASANAFGPE